jgi:hypothetical protein
LTIPVALEFPQGYTGDIAGLIESYEPSAIARPFSDILKQYNNREPIHITGVGCERVCTGKLLGADTISNAGTKAYLFLICIIEHRKILATGIL